MIVTVDDFVTCVEWEKEAHEKQLAEDHGEAVSEDMAGVQQHSSGGIAILL